MSEINTSKQVIDYYVTTPIEKESLEYLLRESRIISQDSCDVFPKRQQNDTVHFIEDAKKFVELTQQYFTTRAHNQERWEVGTSAYSWINPENEVKIRQALDSLGFISEISPHSLSSVQSNVILCILGATLPAMDIRMAYFKKLLQEKIVDVKQISNVVLLAGERHVTLDVDGSEEYLRHIAESRNLSISQLMETHLIQESFNKANLREYLGPNISVEVIDTPKGNLARPTTATTIFELVKWLKGQMTHDRKSHDIIFVSNQPYVLYQEAVIANAFRDAQFHENVKIDLVGPSANPKMTTQKIVANLGSAIWAKTPQIINSLQNNISKH